MGDTRQTDKDCYRPMEESMPGSVTIKQVKNLFAVSLRFPGQC